MKKDEFFKYCSSHENYQDVPLSVQIRNVYRETEHVVALCGVWAGCSILSRELYRPTPTKQWIQSGSTEKKLEEQRVKFQKWLDEFNSKPKPE